MASWRIFYGDGSTYTDEDGSAFEAPALNVQVIACHDPSPRGPGYFLLHRWDYYWFVPDENMWYGGDLFGLFDYLTRPGPKTVKFGRTIDTDVYYGVYQRAKDDPIAQGATP